MLDQVSSPEQSKAKKSVHIETWGCQMNVADSERMLGLLHKSGYEVAGSAQGADLVLLNTCHIREKSKHKVLSRLGELRELKLANPNLIIAVGGCVAQAEGKKLLDEAPGIDVLLGPGKVEMLPTLLETYEQKKQAVSALGFDDKRKSHQPSKSPPLPGMSPVSRFVNIQQGCNNFCTFCVVPFTRGREVSRTPDEITAEVAGFLAEGSREITVLGQNVNSYGRDLPPDLAADENINSPFVALLSRLAKLPGLERLRFTTSNPHDFTDELIELLTHEPRLGRYIHLPAQSGDDEILEHMRRKVTVAGYLDKVSALRKIDPEFAISTDLIVGFPGETEEQFRRTMSLVDKVRFAFAYAFKYSPRRGTAAARFRDQIPENVKTVRLAELNTLQDEITRDWHEREIGRKREVLVLYESKKEPGVFYGRTPQFRPVRILSGRRIVGELVNVQVVAANKTALVGELV